MKGTECCEWDERMVSQPHRESLIVLTKYIRLLSYKDFEIKLPSAGAYSLRKKKSKKRYFAVSSSS